MCSSDLSKGAGYFDWKELLKEEAKDIKLDIDKERDLTEIAGLILGIVSAVFVCKHKKIPFPDGLDATVCGIVLAQSIGRWGNFFNSEAHGGPTDLPWGIQVKGTYVHPTFLYESLWCLILFFVLSHIDSNRKFIGQTSLLYGILYSAKRFFVKGLRTDSLMIGPFRQAQVLSAGVIIVCLILYVILYKKSRQFSK